MLHPPLVPRFAALAPATPTRSRALACLASLVRNNSKNRRRAPNLLVEAEQFLRIRLQMMKVVGTPQPHSSPRPTPSAKPAEPPVAHAVQRKRQPREAPPYIPLKRLVAKRMKPVANVAENRRKRKRLGG